MEDLCFGGISISDKLFDYIRQNLAEGSTILELGSGWATGQLAKYYIMNSVEHDPVFLNEYESNYIYCPLKEHKEIKNHPTTLWYNADILRSKVEGLKYDLLLVDGPPGTRSGFFKYFDMFDSEAIMIFDDLQRTCERKVLNSIASRLKRPYVVYGSGEGKTFGVLNDPIWEKE
jgi:hypothetical protein